MSMPDLPATRLFLGLALLPFALGGASLRFHGNGVNDIDRVKIQIDDPTSSDPGPPADVGAADFTLEFWMRAVTVENTSDPVSCGNNINWIFGNIVFDRDRYNQDRKFGLSIAGGRLVWGVSGDGTGDLTICGTTDVLDGQWHHVAVQRRRADGRMWLFADGQLESQADGPDGDISYPDDGIPGDYCGGPCTNSDPFLVIGAEKHDAGPSYPSYSGWIDEVRLSHAIRYTASFPPSPEPFAADSSTAALYHLDEGSGDEIDDSSGASGGPSDGVRRFGGSPAGPEWSSDTPFSPPASGPGGVPDGITIPGMPLSMTKNLLSPTQLDLTWGPSCSPEASDYAVYEGMVGAWNSHVPSVCSSAGATSVTITHAGGSRYYLIVPLSQGTEGSYGADSSGVQRPRSASPCLPPALVLDCP